MTPTTATATTHECEKRRRTQHCPNVKGEEGADIILIRLVTARRLEESKLEIDKEIKLMPTTQEKVAE